MRLEEGQKALSSLEEYKQLEVQLREEIARLESSRIEETTKLQTELVEKDKKFDSDLSGFKEQIKQHSVTICAMEERLTKVMKKNKEYQEEVESNKKLIQGKLHAFNLLRKFGKVMICMNLRILLVYLFHVEQLGLKDNILGFLLCSFGFVKDSPLLW